MQSLGEKGEGGDGWAGFMWLIAWFLRKGRFYVDTFRTTGLTINGRPEGLLYFVGFLNLLDIMRLMSYNKRTRSHMVSDNYDLNYERVSSKARERGLYEPQHDYT